MTTFTVWKFGDPLGAEKAAEILRGAEKDNLIKVVDHAIASWPKGESRPKTKHSRDDVKSGSAWGVFWGLLFGVLFTIPLLGIAAGASIGALHKMTAGVGIKEDDIKRIRGEITEGTSALFVVTEEGNLDRVAERFHGLHETLIDSNLTGAERHALLEAFDSD